MPSSTALRWQRGPPPSALARSVGSEGGEWGGVAGRARARICVLCGAGAPHGRRPRRWAPQKEKGRVRLQGGPKGPRGRSSLLRAAARGACECTGGGVAGLCGHEGRVWLWCQSRVVSCYRSSDGVVRTVKRGDPLRSNRRGKGRPASVRAGRSPRRAAHRGARPRERTRPAFARGRTAPGPVRAAAPHPWGEGCVAPGQGGGSPFSKVVGGSEQMIISIGIARPRAGVSTESAG
jgi:hypothetical protein